MAQLLFNLGFHNRVLGLRIFVNTLTKAVGHHKEVERHLSVSTHAIPKGLDLNLKGIVVIVGDYGSGKTEVAINLGVKRKLDGLDVLLADLDLVNPYFRTREARCQLSALGIDIILPPRKYLYADLPILSPKVGGLIKKPATLSILDTGGDGVGTRVLAALADMFSANPVEMLQVINPFRPFTTDVHGCLVIRDRIEAASRLKVTGLIANAHFLENTRPEDVMQGYKLVQAVALATGLPVVFITAVTDLLPAVQACGLNCPILPMERRLHLPWLARTNPNRQSG